MVCGQRPKGAYGAAKATTGRNPLRQSLTVTTTKGGGFCFSKFYIHYEEHAVAGGINLCSKGIISAERD